MAARKPIVCIGGQRKQLPDGDVLAVSLPLRYNILGTVSVATGVTAYEFDADYEILSAYFFLQTASSSGSVTAVLKNGASALGTMTVAATGTRSNKLSLTSNVSAGSKLYVDITASGTGTKDLCLVVLYRPR